MINLENKVALITGASRGIGRATAKLFAQAGADVIVNFRRSERETKDLIHDIKGIRRDALAVKADLSDQKQVQKMVRDVVDHFGRIDILVNNAGIWEEGPIDSMTKENWQRTIDINLNSVFYCTQEVVKHMLHKNVKGRIIMISSTAGQRGEPFYSHYAATKGALISMTKSLASELGPKGILVNCIAPGWVDTDMMTGLSAAELKKIASLIPLGHVARPEEVAGPILFLASDLATHINGEILNVNGGSVLCG